MSDDVDALKRELWGVQEMLAQVLMQIGKPVVVTKETLERGLPKGTQIKVDEDLENEAFVFSLEFPDEQ